MSIHVTRKDLLFEADASRVIARFMYTSDERAIELIKRVMLLPEEYQQSMLTQVLRDFSKRHRSISRIFEKHFNRLAHLFIRLQVDAHSISYNLKILIGSYFTMEYSIEAAAFFNPSIVEDPDQTELAPGEKRVIISFRATGEGHVSSVVFRSGIIGRDNKITIEPAGKMLESPEHVKNHTYSKNSFRRKLKEMQDCNRHCLSGYDG